MALSPNQRGALFMVISQAAFTTNDTLVKIATSSLGIGQIMLVRGAVATGLMALILWRLGQLGEIRKLANPYVAVRIAGEIGGTIFYLFALAHLPIANVSAVFQALPLAITVAAALFLGETVGPRRWLAIAVGFVGVMIVVRPGLAGFDAYSLYVLACVICCAFRDLATRRIPATVPSTLVSLLTAASVTICGAVLIPFTGGWIEMTTPVLLVLVGAAVLVLTGYQFIIQCMRVGDISFVAPFRYTALLWAITAGVVVFGNLPDLATIIGAAIVVASGIYTLYRERVAGRTRPVLESTGPTNAADGL